VAGKGKGKRKKEKVKRKKEVADDETDEHGQRRTQIETDCWDPFVICVICLLLWVKVVCGRADSMGVSGGGNGAG